VLAEIFSTLLVSFIPMLFIFSQVRRLEYMAYKLHISRQKFVLHK